MILGCHVPHTVSGRARALSIAGLCVALLSAACGGIPQIPTDPLLDALPTPQSGPVGRVSRDYVDRNRSRWGGGGPRPLTTVVWYPAATGASETDWVIGAPDKPLFRVGRSTEGGAMARSETKRPLVLLSHGTGGSAAMLAWLAEALARNGYVVAAVNHHGNSSAEEAPTPEGFMLWWERATDLTRVLDSLLKDPQFGNVIDPARIGVAGFSLGGYTALEVAGATTSLAAWQAFCGSAQRDATCGAQPEFPQAVAEFDRIRDRPDVRASLEHHGDSFLDARIKAVYAMAPVVSPLTDESLRRIAVPTRIIVGSQDRTAPAATNGARAARLIPGATLRTLEGVGHYSFLAECTVAGMTQQAELCREEPGIDRADVHRRVSGDAVDFFSAAFTRP